MSWNPVIAFPPAQLQIYHVSSARQRVAAVKRRSPPSDLLAPEVRDQVVAFLRDWLPESAKGVYRRMIEQDPERWHLDPHFSGGVILEHALRGNGIDERALGVRDLGPLWPDLVRRAVLEDGNGEKVED